jgi:hypothetical protein
MRLHMSHSRSGSMVIGYHHHLGPLCWHPDGPAPTRPGHSRSSIDVFGDRVHIQYRYSIAIPSWDCSVVDLFLHMLVQCFHLLMGIREGDTLHRYSALAVLNSDFQTTTVNIDFSHIKTQIIHTWWCLIFRNLLYKRNILRLRCTPP